MPSDPARATFFFGQSVLFVIFSKKIAEKFAGKEKVRIFAARLRNNGKFIDKFEKR